MNFGYVCTNYNNSSFTCQAVRSLAENRGHRFHIVVVDNNSDAANVAMLQEFAAQHPEVELVLNPENVGYFPGLNVGIAHMRARHPHVAVLAIGNNDLVFPPDFGARLEENIARLDEHAVVSPDVVTMDGLHQNPHVISGISKRRELVYDLYYANYHLAKLIVGIARLTQSFTSRPDHTQWRIARPIYQGHGSCYLIGPKFFRHFNELWAPTFLMGEEFFLSKQLADQGLQVYYEPAISVRHYCHAAVGQVQTRRMWEIARVAHKIYRRHVRILR